ncbi:MAG: 50S ribosomal protein L31e [Nanoarchaeota archaeon]|nr:50S ribosomal protein L31e [Nanoarchaeota archaeon]MBU1028424.1 50S ribosomal protein L31e [Nanoarchaeota archaeon]
MTTKKQPKIEEKNLERIYIIPLREKCRTVPRYKKTNKAIKTIKEFLVKHMKIYDRDLNKIKIDGYLNEYMWARGIKNPPHKIRVKATKDIEGVVKVELIDYSNKLRFKKIRAERVEKVSKEAAAKKKKVEKQKPEDKDTLSTKEEDKKIEKEKATAGAQAAQKVAETQAKQMKKAKQPKIKQPKHQARKALAK